MKPYLCPLESAFKENRFQPCLVDDRAGCRVAVPAHDAPARDPETVIAHLGAVRVRPEHVHRPGLLPLAQALTVRHAVLGVVAPADGDLTVQDGGHAALAVGRLADPGQGGLAGPLGVVDGDYEDVAGGVAPAQHQQRGQVLALLRNMATDSFVAYQ